MKISIIGTGYVGIVTGACFAERSHDVTCVDIDKKRVDAINSGKSPIYEPGLDEILRSCVGKNMRATTDLKSAVLASDITFICVGTPSKKDGSIDLTFIKNVSKEIGNAMKDKNTYHVVVVKSTVVPGTTETEVIPLLKKKSGKNPGTDFGVGMTPEFLKEGDAINDTRSPDRIVIGAIDDKSLKTILQLYPGITAPMVLTDPRTAEMIKYASNSFLATKISFSNEFANLCELLDIDFYTVARGMGLDSRISPKFLKAGAGFGGSCFPKDIKAIVAMARAKKFRPKLLESVIDVNALQPLRLVELAKKAIGGLKGKKIAILGLSFKPGTDDMREAPSLKVISALEKEKAVLSVYDPVATGNARKLIKVKNLEFAGSVEAAIAGASVCVIVTEWPEFRLPPATFKNLMKQPVIVDGRRLFEPEEMIKNGIKYLGIGWKNT